MARQNEGPWYRASKGTWYLTLPDGKKVSLKVRGEGSKQEAINAWHRFMANPMPLEAPQKVKEAPQKVKEGASVKEVVEAFLSDAKTRVKANTYANYENLLTAFSDKHGRAKAEGFTIAQSLAFVNRDGWSQAYRRTHLGVIKSAFKWGEENGMIAKNPVKAMKRPSMPSRGAKASVSAEIHERLLEASTPCFRLFLTMLHETGCRPSELSRLTAQDVDFGASVAILTEHKTDHNGKPRIIILTPKALDILRTQAKAHPTGTLLRNEGDGWTKRTTNHAMQKARAKAGVKAILYGYRHAYATDALASGVPDAQVAALLGHSGTTSLHHHYSHLTSRTQALKEALGKVR